MGYEPAFAIGAAFLPACLWSVGIYSALSFRKGKEIGRIKGAFLLLSVWFAFTIIYILFGRSVQSMISLGAVLSLLLGATLWIVKRNRRKNPQSLVSDDLTTSALPSNPSPVGIYYYSENGIDSGPHTLNELVELYRNNVVSEGTLVFREGETDWHTFSQFSEFRSILSKEGCESRRDKLSRRISKAALIGILFLAAILVSAFIRGAFKQGGSKRTGAQQGGVTSFVWTSRTLAGLTFESPGKFKLDMPKANPAESRIISQNTVAYDVFSASVNGLGIYVSYVEYKRGIDANLNGAADGAVTRILNLPATVNTGRESRDVLVSGRNGRRISLRVRSNGHRLQWEGLVVVEGPRLWNIQVAFEEGRADLSIAAARILDSVRFSQSR